ncbi:MAG: hypothetical protein SFV54_02570 [Bryobacteraceae bacterium]|nr:hypothetical protein [Bryobacteraceae bacterium]
MGPQERETAAVIATTPHVVRNLRITWSYFQLSAAFSRGLEGHANWCTYATWASRQAGRTIRAEDLEPHIDARLRTTASSFWRELLRRGLFQPETRLGAFVRRVHSPFDAFERSGDAVMRGNLKVYAEIAPVFARALDGTLDPATLEQPLLREAFTNYQQTRCTAGQAQRAQLMLLANVQIGLHEQTRLQPEILESLNAPAAVARELSGRWWKRLVLPGFESYVTAFARAVITARLMTLALPWRTLALGCDLDEPCPPPFETLTHPALKALAQQFPLEGDCGARDWSELPQRMRYIFRLFRACHARAELYNAPFAPAQVALIEAGNLPEGAL